jgi:hypothetical protein
MVDELPDEGRWEVRTGDGLGGSQPCGTTRWRDRTLKCHFVEMRALSRRRTPAPPARESGCIGRCDLRVDPNRSQALGLGGQ